MNLLPDKKNIRVVAADEIVRKLVCGAEKRHIGYALLCMLTKTLRRVVLW